MIGGDKLVPRSGWADRCHICGAPSTVAASDHGSPRCDDCAPAREHVVSMQIADDGDSLAVCPCGWRSKIRRGKGAYLIQDAKVRLHWRAVIRAVREAEAREPVAAFALFFALCGLAGIFAGGL